MASSVVVTQWGTAAHDSRPMVKVRCPKCGMWTPLFDYAIDAAGKVTPIFVCLMPACDFHGEITLSGWKR